MEEKKECGCKGAFNTWQTCPLCARKMLDSKELYVAGRPKVSTYHPFDYKDFISRAKYGYYDKRYGRPMVIMGASERFPSERVEGHEIAIYNNGIEIHSDFSAPNFIVNTNELTADVNRLIVNWLFEQGEYDLIELPPKTY